MKEKESLDMKIFGMILLERGIARQGYLIYDGEEILVMLLVGLDSRNKRLYANGLIKSSYKMGDIVTIEIRNKRVQARLRKRSYIKKNYEVEKWDITQKLKNGF